MAETFLTSGIFAEYILPFLLVFIIIFAIFQKVKFFGDGKKQIDALVALVIALIFLAFEGPRMAVVNLMPLLVIAIIIIFVFMLLWGFVGGKVDTGMNKGLKIGFGILIGLFVILAGLYVTGTWVYVYDLLISGGSSSKIWTNILLLAIVGGAVALVLSTGSDGKGKP